MKDLMATLIIAGLVGCGLITGGVILMAWIDVVGMIWELIGGREFSIAIVLLSVGLFAAYAVRQQSK